MVVISDNTAPAVPTAQPSFTVTKGIAPSMNPEATVGQGLIFDNVIVTNTLSATTFNIASITATGASSFQGLVTIIPTTPGAALEVGTAGANLTVNTSTGAVTTTNNTLDDGTSGNISIKGIATKYDNISTVGLGLPVSIALYNTATPLTTSTSNLIKFTPPASSGVYKIVAVVANTSSTNTGTTAFNVTYTNVNGTAISATMALTSTAGANSTTATGASTAFYAKEMTIHTDNSATAITVSTTCTGTVSYIPTVVLTRIV